MTNKTFLNLSGQYNVHGYDIHDGPFSDSRLIITLDEKCSDFAHGHITYQCKAFTADGIETYHGSIIANGNNFAMSFKNILPGQESDNGVIFGTVTHDRDENGKNCTVLHNTFYQPNYKGGGYGTATALKEQT